MRYITYGAAALLAALAAGAATAAQDNQRSSKDTDRPSAAKSDKGATSSAPTVVLFPPLVVIDAKFSGGCWARLYSDQNFRGDTLTLGGAGDYASFKTSYANVIRKWDSIELGPKTTLTAYDNEDYTQPVATFKPSQRITDLDDKLGLLENVRAVRMRCGK